MLLSSFSDLFLFAPILLLGWKARPQRRQPKVDLGPGENPTDGQLSALQREFLDDREPIHLTVPDLVRYLDPIDQMTIIRCADAAFEWADPKTGTREARMRQCRSFWCPWCIRKAHQRRTRYQYAKLQSIQPPGEDQLRIFNIVAELPVELHDLVRHDETCMKAWITGIRRTFADVFRYKGRDGASAERSAWANLGAIFNFHAIGDEGTPFPKYFPHWDILLSAYCLREGTLERLNPKWPEGFDRTREKYRENIRAAFLPIAQKGMHKSMELEAFLRTEFSVIWHVGRPRKGSGEGYVHVRNAAHRVRYSCRPLFGLDRCRLEKDESGKEFLIYTPMPNARKRVEHCVPPGPAFGALRHMKDQLDGKHARRIMGTLKGAAYKRVLKVSGRPKVVEQQKTGRKLVRAWIPQGDGTWNDVDPREAARY